MVLFFSVYVKIYIPGNFQGGIPLNPGFSIYDFYLRSKRVLNNEALHSLEILRLIIIHFRTTDTFWTTTGLYPQNFTLSFPDMMNVNAIRLQCFDGM